ncbi:N-acetyltransferase [Chloroflexota bacterium]
MEKVEKARITDAPHIHKLINYFADQSLMLPRSLSEIYEDIRDYFVLKDGDRIIACASLHINWADLAEIKSVAVAEDKQKQGLGDKIIKACLEEAKDIGIPTIFCLTYQPGFFEKFGFTQLDKMDLPQKVWNECFRCPKFPDCDEIALIYHLEAKS